MRARFVSSRTRQHTFYTLYTYTRRYEERWPILPAEQGFSKSLVARWKKRKVGFAPASNSRTPRSLFFHVFFLDAGQVYCAVRLSLPRNRTTIKRAKKYLCTWYFSFGERVNNIYVRNIFHFKKEGGRDIERSLWKILIYNLDIDFFYAVKKKNSKLYIMYQDNYER